MKLECRDCRFGISVEDKSIKLCPQCGSDNIEFLSPESKVHVERAVEISHDKGKKKKNIFLIVSVAVSLLCGIVATVVYIDYLIDYNVFDPYFDPSGSNYNPNMWVIIPIFFVVGFFVPAIAYVIWYVVAKIDEYVP